MANATGTVTGQAAEHLTQVRRLLRQREYRRAVEMIDRHLLDGDPAVAAAAPVPAGDLRTYAYERLTGMGPEPARRPFVNLRRGRPVSLRRAIPVDLRRLGRVQLERVLRWLLSGEVHAADEALRADAYADAVAAAEFAERIDNRCVHLAMVHARALYELAVEELKEQPADLDDVAPKLRKAARLVERAAGDPTLRDPHKKLSVAIEDVTAIVERRRSRAAQADAVAALVRRFNRLVQHYDDGDQIVSHVQLGNARASLAQIRAEVDRLGREHPPETPAGRLLVDLRGQCARYKEYLERLGRTVRAD